MARRGLSAFLPQHWTMNCLLPQGRVMRFWCIPEGWMLRICCVIQDWVLKHFLPQCWSFGCSILIAMFTIDAMCCVHFAVFTKDAVYCVYFAVCTDVSLLEYLHVCNDYATKYCTKLHHTSLHCNALYWIALNCTAQHCTLLQYCTSVNTKIHCRSLHCREGIKVLSVGKARLGQRNINIK